jgi:poly(glycerol-phosphate) alpha-glucosyltransferase
MLDDWALHNAHWKKRLAGWLYEHANLEEAACIQVFHDDERRAVREYGVDTPICVVPNGVTLPEDRSPARPPPWEGQIPEDRHVLLFLGRIHPKKGLQELVEAWSQVQSDCPDASSWTLAIVGWDDGGHRPDLERYVRKAGLSSSVVFPGPQFGSDKAAAFADADAFILPSHSEGLPMAVLEAWSYRLPVVMTAECNLPEGFEESAALQVSPDPASIAEGLERLFDRSGNERSALGERGRTLVQRKFTWPSVARQMHEVYRWMLGKRKAPSCVRFG